MENASSTLRSPRRAKPVSFLPLIGKINRTRSSNESKVEIGQVNKSTSSSSVGNKRKLKETEYIDTDEGKKQTINESTIQAETGNINEEENRVKRIKQTNYNHIKNKEDKIQPKSATTETESDQLSEKITHHQLSSISNNANSLKVHGIKEGRWTKEEHEGFLIGYEKYGKSWKDIAMIVKTRTAEQIRTHAQKHFLRNNKQTLKSEKELQRRQAEKKEGKKGNLKEVNDSPKDHTPVSTVPPPGHFRPHIIAQPMYHHPPPPPHLHPHYQAHYRDRTASLGDASTASQHSVYSQASAYGHPYYGYSIPNSLYSSKQTSANHSRSNSFGEPNFQESTVHVNGEEQDNKKEENNGSDEVAKNGHRSSSLSNNGSTNGNKAVGTKQIGIENSNSYIHPHAHLNAGIYYHNGQLPTYGYNHMHMKVPVDRSNPTSGTSTPSTAMVPLPGNHKPFINDPNLNMITRTRKISDSNAPFFTHRDRSEAGPNNASEVDQDSLINTSRSRKVSDASFHFETSNFYDDDNFNALRSRKNTITNIMSNVGKSNNPSPAISGMTEDPYMSGMPTMNLDGMDGSGSANGDMLGRNSIGEVMKAISDIQKMGEEDEEQISTKADEQRGSDKNNGEKSSNKTLDGEGNDDGSELKKTLSIGAKLQNLQKLDKMESSLSLHALGNIENKSKPKPSAYPIKSSNSSNFGTSSNLNNSLSLETDNIMDNAPNPAATNKKPDNNDERDKSVENDTPFNASMVSVNSIRSATKVGSASHASNNSNTSVLQSAPAYNGHKLPSAMRTIPLAVLQGKFNAVGPTSGPNSGTATPTSTLPPTMPYPFPYPYGYGYNPHPSSNSTGSHSFKFHPISLISNNPNALHSGASAGSANGRSRSNSINSNPLLFPNPHAMMKSVQNYEQMQNRSRASSSVSSMDSVGSASEDEGGGKKKKSSKTSKKNGKGKKSKAKAGKISSDDTKNSSLKEGRWTAPEHELFLSGYQKFGKSWKNIAREFLPCRTPEQIRTHAQKYFQKCRKTGVQPVQPRVHHTNEGTQSSSINKAQKKMETDEDELDGDD